MIDRRAEYNPIRVVERTCRECGQPIETPAVVVAGSLRMDRERMIAWVDGVETKRFTPLEFEVLWRIASREGRIAPHWFLEEDASGREHAGNTIKTIIRYVRAKLMPHDIIETRRGQGYRIRA